MMSEDKAPATITWWPPLAGRAGSARGRLFYILGWNLFAAVLGFALNLDFYLHHLLRWEFVREFFVVLIYTNSVGMLIGLTFEFTAVGRFLARQSFPRNYLWLIFLLLALTVTGCLIANVIVWFFGMSHSPDLWHGIWIALGQGIVLILLLGVGGAVLDSYRVRFEQAVRELHARELNEARFHRLAAEVQLSSLESRVHPHFIFNTLNSIAALVRHEPLIAERTIVQLSGLLRFSLDSCGRSTVPFTDELQIVEKYLEIEKVRFGARLRYDFDVSAAPRSLALPPLSLQTLVENSVKYAVSSRREGALIRLAVRAEGGQVKLEVIDDGPGFTRADLHEGHGLQNLCERLRALYGREGSLDIARRAEQTVVTLTLPFVDAQAATATD